MKQYLPEISWHDRAAIMSLDFQRDEHRLISAARYKLATCSIQAEVRLWELCFDDEGEGGKKAALTVNFVANLVAHRVAVNVVRFSLDGGRLASGDSDGLICVWADSGPSSAPDIFAGDDMPPNKENWAVTRRLRAHQNDVCDLAWAPDGTKIISVSVDRSAIVYSVDTGKHLRIIKDYKQFPIGVCWDPRDKYLCTLSTDRELHVFSSEAPKFTRLRRITKADLPRISDLQLDPGRYSLFHDDQLVTFVRRCCFSPDGELLIVPSGLLESGHGSLFVSYIFLRGDFEKPVAILSSSSPTFMARCCPVIFPLQRDSDNQVTENFLELPFRVVFTLLTKDAVIFYDSQHEQPFAFFDNAHYSNLTDLSWSADGRLVLVASSDGYCSVVRFDLNELGQHPEPLPTPPPSPQLLPLKTPKRPRTLKPADTPESSNPSASIADPDKSAKMETPKPIKLERAKLNTTPKMTPFLKAKESQQNNDTDQPPSTCIMSSTNSPLSSIPPVAKQPRRVQLTTLTAATASPSAAVSSDLP